MQRVIHIIHTLLNSPHHLVIYIAVFAALLICIPLARAIFGRRNKSEEDSSSHAASPSMLGLSSPPVDFKSGPVEVVPPRASKVTAINESLTVPCIHCGVTISTRQDFCPACGYAQPAKQSVAAAFPA